MKNKYHEILGKILNKGKTQVNKKGSIVYLTDEVLRLKPADLLEIFETHGVARNKLKAELELFQKGNDWWRLIKKTVLIGGITVVLSWLIPTQRILNSFLD